MPELFGPNVKFRRTIRATPNPMDKATVVSIYPKDIDEKKWTIQPGRFIIPKGSVENPSLLVVGPSSWWRDIDIDQPLLEIPNSAIQIAASIVDDYMNGLIGFKKGESTPGLFWVPGSFKTIEELKKTTFDEIGTTGDLLFKRAVARQQRYWEILVKLADIGWTKTNANPLAISDDMRMAAHILNLREKPWMKDQQVIAMINCKACGHLVNPDYPVCSNCKAIVDPEKAKSLNIKFAE